MTDLARLVLDTDTRGLKQGERDLKSLSGRSRETARSVDQSSSGMVKSFGKVAGAIGGAFAASGAISSLISVNRDFGASMQRVAAISDATTEEFKALREAAMEMGATTQFSASQAADGLGFLVMAGFDASEAIEALPNVLSLAAASGMELATAADIASNVLSGFGKEAEDAGEVSDVLAAAASRTNTSVGQLGQAMSTAAPIAASLGISMQETAAAIGVVSDAGIQGERAGTALRGVFASLAGPTKQAKDALLSYRLAAEDVNPETVGLAEAMARLDEVGLSTADAMTIFGREAASAALVMAENADRIGELTTEFEDAEGAAAEMAATMRDNLNGDIQELTSTLEGLQIALGDQGATSGFRSLAQTATQAVRVITQNLSTLINVVSTAAVGFATYRGALLAANVATGIATSSLVAQTAQFAASTQMLRRTTQAQILLTTATRGFFGVIAANPFGAAAIALGALTSAMYSFAESQRAARAETNNLINSLRGLAQARAAEFASARAEALQEANRLRERRAELELERQRLENLPGAEFLSPGRFRQVNSELTRVGLELVGIESKIALADKAFEEATKAAEDLVKPTEEVTETTNLAADALEELADAAKAANDNVKELVTGFENLRVVAPREGLLGGLNPLAAFTSGSDATLRNGSFGAFDKDFGLGKAVEGFDATLGDMKDSAETQTVAIARTFQDMAQDISSSLTQLGNSIRSGSVLEVLGSVVSLFTSLGSTGLFGQSIASNINRPRSFDGGGYTGGGARSGGIDGKGGFLAMLHPRETVVDHTRGQGGGAATVRIVMDESTGRLGAFVDNRMATAAPVIIEAGANAGVAKMANQRSRSLVA